MRRGLRGRGRPCSKIFQVSGEERREQRAKGKGQRKEGRGQRAELTPQKTNQNKSNKSINQNKSKQIDCSEWEIRLENLWKFGEVVDPLDLPLLDTLIKYPDLSIQPFQDMVKGMLMDIPGLGQDRYSNFDELHLYCYRVAGTVGLMMTPIFGCAPDSSMELAKEPSLSLGVAFQLTNILRDVGEDATRGRIYLPKEDMDKFGVTEEQIFANEINENYKDLMKYEIGQARKYYERAKRGIPMLSNDSRFPVQASLDCYSQILDKLEKNYFDNFTKRAYVSKEEKLMTLPASWYRTTDLANVLPLWGESRPAKVVGRGAGGGGENWDDWGG